MTEKIIIAFIGIAGAVVGALATLAAQLVNRWLDQRAQARRDQPRKTLLLAMLNDQAFTWRRFETLQHVIGADEAETKRLLLELGARASEDGKPLWGLVSRNPLPEAP